MARIPGWLRALGNWWRDDPFRPALLAAGFLWAAFLTQGLPYWDSDFTLFFPNVQGKSLGRLLWDWISPVSTHAENWGFLDRAAQFLAYKVSYQIAGYDPWPYSLLRNLCYAGLGVMIYSWARRLTGPSKSRWPAAAAAVFFLLTPGPIAAHVWLADFAPVAEFVFLCLTYVLWRAVEATPAEWQSLSPANPEQRRWLLKWIGLAFCTYLGYKTKADLKLIPAIVAGYVLLLRRRQWKLFAAPLALMVLLAVPWSMSGGAGKLPPFLPGSNGSADKWMWQPASLTRLGDFFWSTEAYSFRNSFHTPTLSLAGTLGPFLLTALLIFLVWKTKFKIRWTAHEEATDRARIFVVLWLGAILVGVSALPGIAYFFRIRYSIMPLVPVSILLGWLFDGFRGNWDRLPRWAIAAGLAALLVQTSVNCSRSVRYRRWLGQTMVATDEAYERINTTFPNDVLALAPDFLPYAYRVGSARGFRQMHRLARVEDLAGFDPRNPILMLSWQASLWQELDLAEQFSGCRSSILFDRLVPCEPGTGLFVFRYIGEEASFLAADAARIRGDMETARAGYEAFAARHPKNLAGQFWVGFAAFYQKDYAAADRANARVEAYLPNHQSVLYNRATSLMELQQYGPAIERLERLVQMNPGNSAAQLNLYWSHRKAGHEAAAAERLQTMLRLFPTNAVVQDLAANPN